MKDQLLHHTQRDLLDCGEIFQIPTINYKGGFPFTLVGKREIFQLHFKEEATIEQVALMFAWD